MKVKMFELRDRATFIPVVCVEMNPYDFESQETWLLRRAGYSEMITLILITKEEGGKKAILMTNAEGGKKAEYDPYNWGDRTYSTAHRYIQENWDSLDSGDVIDVEFILGETKTRKVSERYE